MADREKVIKSYEDFVNGYECFCTSDDYEYEMHKAVLALLKEQKEKMEHLNNITLEYEKEVFRLQTMLKEQEADKNKYEYKYDHTDCLWYGSGNCPSTCSQYRDGWNDAMDYIFKDGKGYQPYEGR